jgi:hypothetical protein
MSLRVLDVVVNSLLGRPAATSGVHSNLQALIDENVALTQDKGMICLVASYKIISLINNIVDEIYDRKQVTIALVKTLLQRLESWSQALPQFLRTAPTSTTSELSTEKSAIGRVHVSCLYYFALMMATRPILVSTLVQQPGSGLVHSRIASACLDAATFLVKTCLGAKNHNILQANMCILKYDPRCIQ